MAEQKIKYDELFDRQNIEQGLEQLSKSISDAIAKGYAEGEKRRKTVQGTAPNTKAGQTALKKEAAAITKVVAETKELERIKKQLLTTNAKLSAVTKGDTYELEKKRIQLQRVTKAQRDRINAELDAASATKKNTSFTQKMGAAFKKAGKQVLAMGAASLGAAAILRSMFRVIKSGFKTTIEFEKSMSMVKAITGATGKAFNQLRQSAIDLGGSTAFTASQVASLQKEYAKLGFTNDEILKVTQGTLDLAAATGEDLAQSAAIAGATLRGFGLDAGEMQRVVDVMAKSFTSSALDLTKFETAMKNVAPVAAATGDSIEQATAKLAVLADAGLDASTSGTSMRNIYLELEKRGLSWDEAMTQINNSQNKASTSLQLFGKRGAVAGLILAGNTEKADEMQMAFEDANGAAKEMADINLENVAGQITMLKSAWEGLILRTNESEGALRDYLYSLTLLVSSINNEAKPAIDSLFAEDKKIETMRDRFQFFVEMGYGTAQAWAAARVTTNKAIEAMIAKGKEGYKKMQADEAWNSKVSSVIATADAKEKQRILDKQNADIAAEEARMEAAEKARNTRIKAATAYREKQSQTEKKAIAKAGQEAYKDIILSGQQEIFTDELAAMRTNEENKAEILRASAEMQKGINKEVQRENLLGFMETTGKILDVAADLANRTAAIVEQQKQRELSAAGDNAAEREEIEKKYFKKQQALSIASTIIEGANAVVRQFADLPFPAALVTSAFITALTGAQVGMIASQKFAKGGFGVLGGHIHSEGGTMIPGVGEAEKGEAVGILSRRATQSYGPDMLESVFKSLENGSFHNMWGRANTQLVNVSVPKDEYTEKMYNIMKRTPVTYQDTSGAWCILYPDGSKDIIKN